MGTEETRAAPELRPLLRELLSHQRDFVAFLERRLGDRALAEDVLQDALVRSFDKLDTLRDPAAAVPWFYRVLRNAAIDHQRSAASKARALSALAVELENEAFADEDELRTVCTCVNDAVAMLTKEQATALRRIEVDGVAVKDYAKEAGITSNNAGVRVHRARKTLRERLRATCGACAERGCVDCTCGS